MVALDGDRAAIMDVQTMEMTPYVLVYKAPRIEADLVGFIKPYTYTVSAVVRKDACESFLICMQHLKS